MEEGRKRLGEGDMLSFASCLKSQKKKKSACIYPKAVPLGFQICCFFFLNPFILSHVSPCQPGYAQLSFEVSVKMPPFPGILASTYRATTLPLYSVIRLCLCLWHSREQGSISYGPRDNSASLSYFS